METALTVVESQELQPFNPLWHGADPRRHDKTEAHIEAPEKSVKIHLLL